MTHRPKLAPSLPNAVLRDKPNHVSEPGKVQHQLEESERRLRYVLDATGEGVWDWDIASGIVTHNRQWCQITGLDEACLHHRLAEFAALLHPDDKDLVMHKLQACLEGHARYQSEHRMCLGNQQVVWVLDRGDVVARDAAGKPLRMVGSLLDISDRKAAELQAAANAQQVREHAAQLDAIFDLSPDGLVTFDSHNCVKYVSPAFFTLTGLARKDVMGADDATFSDRLAALCVHQARFPGIAALRRNLYAGTELARAGKPNNAPRQLIELAAAGQRVLEVGLRESVAAGVSRVLYLRDITHESEADRMRSEFLSTAAHKLRTPMASVYGFAEVLLTLDTDPAERQELLEIIYRQSGLMSSILNGLLDLARIEARRGKDFVFEAVQAQALVRTVTLGFKPPGERLAPVLDMPDVPMFIQADHTKAQTAILNVLSNAYKYSGAGGPVHLGVKAQPGAVAVCITDQGIGMTPAQAGRVGERFYRADTSGKVPGTGLGMSIVKAIMALHHGHVEVDSTPGQGTRVTLVFPAIPHA